MGLFSILKRNSKLALRGSWGRAILIILILMGVSLLISTLSQITTSIFVVHPTSGNPMMEPNYLDDPASAFAKAFNFSIPEWIIMAARAIMSLLLVTPLSLGAIRWYYSLVHGQKLPLSEIFYFFESGKAYGRAICYEFLVGIRTFLWSILFFIVPGGIFGISIYFLSGTEELPRSTSAIASTGIFLAVILAILAMIFYAACINRYTLTPYLLSEDPELSVRQAIKTSIKYTRGYRFSLVWFGFSYFGWLLLCVFVFPMLYVQPYYSTGFAMYARFIIEKNRFEVPEQTQEFSASTCEIETNTQAPELTQEINRTEN